MKRNWNEDELLEHFIIVPIERKLIGNKAGTQRKEKKKPHHLKKDLNKIRLTMKAKEEESNMYAQRKNQTSNKRAIS